MDKYALYIYLSYGISAAGMILLFIMTLSSRRASQHQLKKLEQRLNDLMSQE